MNSKQRRQRKKFEKMVMFNVSQVFRETAIRVEEGDLTTEEVVKELFEAANEIEKLYKEV